ncbi:MAG: cytochrome P450, partial [Stackebrandtia sp.]
TRIARLIGRALRDGLSHGRVETLVDELLDPVLDRGRMDALADLAFPLAATVVCELIGIPPEDRLELRSRVLALGPAFIPYVPEDQRAAVNDTVTWLRNYVGGLLEQRRRQRRDDLLSRMLDIQDESGQLGDEESVDNAVFLSFAGFETTVNLIAAGCSLLASHPDQLALLRADRSLVPRAVEEMLRYESPIQMTGRFVLEPVTVGGRTLRAGRTVLLLLASANHDERQFPDPERFDVTRAPNAHVAFGGGAHFCLGARLARLEARTVFERLLDRTAAIEPLGAIVRERRPIFRGIREAPVAVRAA